MALFTCLLNIVRNNPFKWALLQNASPSTESLKSNMQWNRITLVNHMDEHVCFISFQQEIKSEGLTFGTTWLLRCCMVQALATGWSKGSIGFWSGGWNHTESSLSWETRNKMSLRLRLHEVTYWVKSASSPGRITHSCSWSSRTTASSSFFSCKLRLWRSSRRVFSFLVSNSAFFSWDSRKRTSSSK